MIFLSLIFLIIGFLILYSVAYAQKIYPNTKIAGIKVGGMKTEEVQKIIEEKIAAINNQEITFTDETVNKTVKPQNLAISYQPELSVSKAYEIGRTGNIWQKIISRLTTIFHRTDLLAAFQLDRKNYNEIINELAEKINLPEKDASCYIENGQVQVAKEQTGKKLEIELLKDNFTQKIGMLQTNRVINLSITQLPPKVLVDNVNLAREKAQNILDSQVELVLTDDKKISMEKKDVANWLEFVTRNQSETNHEVKYILDIQLNQEKVKDYISKLATSIDQEPVDAKLSISGGKASVFQASQKGYSLNRDETVKTITNELLRISQVAGVNSQEERRNSLISIKLPIEVRKPQISEDQIDNLGIKELIASGTTNFKGSPANRIYNITLGAKFLNGAIIKPGEEFSFTTKLGSVSEERGFKKELVIKEDRTEPEVGGGLCQVSTTMFRAALNAGLKITERSNHRYRVSYYEPPVGLDATVYDPSPDLKFINDTPGYILIQGSVSGTRITFDLYGTKDGREVYISNPEVYDIVNPPDPQYVDDPSLAPGETKYKEKAHQGSKAKVTYIVKKDGKDINKQTFYSTYVAWGAIILRGPGSSDSTPSGENTPTPQETNNSSSSPSPSSSPTTQSPTPSPSASPSPTST